MPKTKISEFSATPASNTDIDSINISEGCAPSGINDAIRELMAQLKDFQTGAVGDSFNGPVGTTTAAAGAFTTLAASGAVTLSGGTANGVTYLNGSKVLTSGSALTYSTTSGLTTNGVTQGYNTTLYTVDGTLSSYSAANNVYLNGNTAGGLDLRGDGTGSASSRLFLGGATSSEASKIIFTVANSEGMRLTSTGLGIGTSSPASKLQISASSGGDTSGLRITRTDTGGGDWRIWSTSNANGEGGGKLIFGTASNYMTLNGSGNLGIGTTSPSTKFEVKAGNGGQMALNNDGSQYTTALWQNNGTSKVEAYWDQTNTLFAIGPTPASSTLVFQTVGSERARIDSSGNLLVGTTSTVGGAKQTIYAANLSVGNGLSIQNGTAHPSGAGSYIQFYNSAGSTAGYINQTGTTTVSYTTSSDYRLKENITPMTGALAKVAQLKPVTYKWKSDELDGEGFIAHELAEVCPQAVVGEKDAVDAEGNPKYQGIDTSFLVATLTAAIQEQQAIIESLKARLDAANL
jgi:hypothetical protein